MAQRAWRPGRHVAWRRIGEETVVIDLQGRRMYGLDAAGGAVWHRLAAGVAPLDGETTAAVTEFLADLAGRGLVEEGYAEPASGPRPIPAPAPVAARPTIVWQEEIRAFGASCAFVPGLNALCDAQPFS